jgi:hypothetical protein
MTAPSRDISGTPAARRQYITRTPGQGTGRIEVLINAH